MPIYMYMCFAVQPLPLITYHVLKRCKPTKDLIWILLRKCIWTGQLLKRCEQWVSSLLIAIRSYGVGASHAQHKNLNTQIFDASKFFSYKFLKNGKSCHTYCSIFMQVNSEVAIIMTIHLYRFFIVLVAIRPLKLHEWMYCVNDLISLGFAVWRVFSRQCSESDCRPLG